MGSPWSPKKKRLIIGISTIAILIGASSAIYLGLKPILNPNTNPNSEPTISKPLRFENNQQLEEYFDYPINGGLTPETALIIEDLFIKNLQAPQFTEEGYSFYPSRAGLYFLDITLYVTIRNCTFINWNGGILMYECKRISIENCTFKNCIIGIDGDSLEEITITNNNISYTYFGIQLGTSKEIEISHNFLSNNFEAIYMSNVNNSQIINNLIKNTKGFENNGLYSGIILISSKNNIIQENVLLNATLSYYNSAINQIKDSNTYNGLPISIIEDQTDLEYNNQDLGYITFVNCSSIYINNCSTIQHTGIIRFVDCSNITIVNSSVKSQGIRATKITISNSLNIIIANSSFNTQIGLEISGSNRISITNNDFRNSNLGIRMWNTNNTDCTNNSFHNCSYALYLYSGTNKTIENNSIYCSKVYFASNVIKSDFIFLNNKYDDLPFGLFANESGNVLEMDLTLKNYGCYYIVNCQNFTWKLNQIQKDSFICIQNSNQFIIEDCMLNSELLIKYCSDFLILNTTITNNSISVSGAFDFSIDDCKVSNSDQSGINLIDCTNFLLTDCESKNNKENGIKITDLKYGQIENSVVRNNSNGVLFSNVEFLDITNLTSKENTKNGILGIASEGISINECLIENNKDEGIYLVDVSDSWIYNNYISTNGQSGFHFLFSDDVLVCNNRFHENEQFGLVYENCLFPKELSNEYNRNTFGEIRNFFHNTSILTEYFDLSYTITIAKKPLYETWSTSYSWGSSTTYFSQSAFTSWNDRYTSIVVDVFISEQYIREHNIKIYLEEDGY